jgi:hypothetical protein
MNTPTRKIPNADGGALVASRVISTTPIKLFSLIVLNTGGAQYIQLFESGTVPIDTTVPELPAVYVAANSTVQFDFGVLGVDFDSLSVSNSSTAATKTIGAADCAITAIVRG